jgi:hypothetical protein
MEVSRRSWIIGEGNGTRACSYVWYRGILVVSSSASSSVLSKMFPLISSLFWCHMYDVLVYKMLWDRKKILNISLWRIIRLSMRPDTGLCPHISLERILVYTVLV